MNQAGKTSRSGSGPALALGAGVVVVALAAALGWLTAEVGIWVALRVAGALLLPTLLMTGMVQASKRKIEWLMVMLTVALWTLAAFGAWMLVR